MSLQLLCRNLREIIGTNQQIYQLATEKKDILIVGNIDALARVVQQEGELIKRMGKLEAERQQLVNHIIQQYDIRQNEVRLSDLLAQVPNSPDKEELSQLFVELSALLSEVHSLNELNQQLIENSLDFVNYSIELFTDTEDEQIYQKPIAQDTSSTNYQRRSIFDTKA